MEMSDKIAENLAQKYKNIREGVKSVMGGQVLEHEAKTILMDELSLFLAPVTDGGRGSASLFTQIPALTEGAPVEFLLKETEQIGDGGLRLKYQPKNCS